MRIYLDNCCYNRPYDDQSQLRISLETQTKLFIQEQITAGKIELVSSYVLIAENSMNRILSKRENIRDFITITQNIMLVSRIKMRSRIKPLKLCCMA